MPKCLLFLCIIDLITGIIFFFHKYIVYKFISWEFIHDLIVYAYKHVLISALFLKGRSVGNTVQPIFSSTLTVFSHLLSLLWPYLLSRPLVVAQKKNQRTLYISPWSCHGDSARGSLHEVFNTCSIIYYANSPKWVQKYKRLQLWSGWIFQMHWRRARGQASVIPAMLVALQNLAFLSEDICQLLANVWHGKLPRSPLRNTTRIH